MTEQNMNIAELIQLLDANWLDEEHKDIIKTVIKRTIKLMPAMMDMVEKAIQEIKND